MTRRERVLDTLYSYNENEKIYKRYYELRDNDEARHAFMNRVEDYVRKHYLFIDEYPFISVPDFFSESNILPQLGLTKRMNVYLMKHDRYTPVFLHRQDFFEVVYVLSGSCDQMIDGEAVPLKKGDMCFIPPFVPHTLEVFDDSVIVNLQIRRDTFDDLFFNLLRYDNILSDFFMSSLYSQHPANRIVFSTGDDEEIPIWILEMYEEMLFPDEYSGKLLIGEISALFIKTLRGYGKTASLKKDTAHLRSSRNALRLITYINDHYRDITLEKLAEQFNYSVPYCSKLIRDETGMGFVFFVRRVRMNRAASLLQNTGSSVANIGEMVGYENTESFIRAFQKVYHQSPRAYRKSHSQGSAST